MRTDWYAREGAMRNESVGSTATPTRIALIDKRLAFPSTVASVNGLTRSMYPPSSRYQALTRTPRWRSTTGPPAAAPASKLRLSFSVEENSARYRPLKWLVLG